MGIFFSNRVTQRTTKEEYYERIALKGSANDTIAAVQ